MKLVYKKPTAAMVRNLEFIFSDDSVDRYGDVIDQRGWELSDFKKNPIALAGHKSDFVIGKWRDVRVEAGKLRGHLELAPEGTSTRIDEVRRLIEADILRSCSVGFVPIKSEPLPNGTGTKYLRQRLVECSVVSIPANANALMMEARALGVRDSTLAMIFKTTDRERDYLDYDFRGRDSRDLGQTLAQRQADARATLARKAAREKLIAQLKIDNIATKVDIKVRAARAQKDYAEEMREQALYDPDLRLRRLRWKKLKAKALVPTFPGK